MTNADSAAFSESHETMKKLMLVPVLLCAVPAVSFLSPTVETVARPALVNPVAYEGTVVGWLVSVDGTVAVRLDGTHESKEFSLWFATPASRTATTRYESLVLEAVLAVSGPLKGELVTVVSESSTQDAGKSIEDAMTLNSIGQK